MEVVFDQIGCRLRFSEVILGPKKYFWCNFLDPNFLAIWLCSACDCWVSNRRASLLCKQWPAIAYLAKGKSFAALQGWSPLTTSFLLHGLRHQNWLLNFRWRHGNYPHIHTMLGNKGKPLFNFSQCATNFFQSWNMIFPACVGGVIYHRMHGSSCPLPALRSKPKPHVSKVIWCVLPLFLRSAFREMAMFMFDFVVEHRGLPREKSGFGSYFKKVK